MKVGLKLRKLFVVVGMLCTVLGFGAGCATEVPAPGEDPIEATSAPVEESTDEAMQALGSCDAWFNCYAFCRRRFQCTTPAGCNALANCLNGCDASFPVCVGQ